MNIKSGSPFQNPEAPRRHYDVISGKHKKLIKSKTVHDRRVATMQH